MPAMILFDVLRRYLEYRGYQVTFVQNFTDVDDKIINRANEEGTTSQAISEKYIEEYFKDAHGLGVRDATIHPQGHGEHRPDHRPGPNPHRQGLCLRGERGCVLPHEEVCRLRQTSPTSPLRTSRPGLGSTSTT